MPQRRKPAKSTKAKYDPAIWEPLDSEFARRRAQRQVFAKRHRADEALQARANRIYRLLNWLGEGTPSQKSMHLGELVIPPAAWALPLLLLARAWKQYPGLYDHGLVPRLLIRADESCLAYDLARDIFEFACRDASLDDVVQYVTDAVARLRANRKEGFVASLIDESGGLPMYFGRLAFWFGRTGSDIWGHSGVRDLVVSIMPDRNGPSPRSHTEPTPDASLRDPLTRRDRPAPLRPEDEMETLRTSCPKVLNETPAGFGPAHDWLEFLDAECEQLHVGAERLATEGDYSVAIDAAADICEWAHFAPPVQPNRAQGIRLAAARNYVSACRQLFMDRARPEYWVWRHATSGCTGADFFIKWHLEQMMVPWGLSLYKLPEALGVFEVLNTALAEFEYLHTQWALPHYHKPNYQPVAAYVVDTAGFVLPEPPAQPTEVYRFARLQALIRDLCGRVQQQIPKPAARRRGRKVDTDPAADQRLVERYQASGMSRQTFAAREGIAALALRQALDRVRKRKGPTPR